MSSAVPLPGPGWVLVEESLYCTTLQEFLGPLRFVTAEEKRVERIDQWQCGGRERGREPGRPEKIKRIFKKKRRRSIEPLEHTCVLLCQPVKQTTCSKASLPLNATRLPACSLNLKNADTCNFFQMYFATLRLDPFNQSQVWFL